MFNFNFSTWKLPHFLTVIASTIGAAVAGALVTYVEAVPASELLQDLTTPAGLTALLHGALSVGLIAGLTALIGVAKQMLPTVPPAPSSTSKIMGGMLSAFLMLLLTVHLAACKVIEAVFPKLDTIEQVVAADLAAGYSAPQIDSDVCKALGGNALTDAICADVTQIVVDVIPFLLDSGAVSSAKGVAAGRAVLAVEIERLDHAR
jgi:hypothetical protein